MNSAVLNSDSALDILAGTILASERNWHWLCNKGSVLGSLYYTLYHVASTAVSAKPWQDLVVRMIQDLWQWSWIGMIRAVLTKTCFDWLLLHLVVIWRKRILFFLDYIMFEKPAGFGTCCGHIGYSFNGMCVWYLFIFAKRLIVMKRALK